MLRSFRRSSSHIRANLVFKAMKAFSSASMSNVEAFEFNDFVRSFTNPSPNLSVFRKSCDVLASRSVSVLSNSEIREMYLAISSTRLSDPMRHLLLPIIKEGVSSYLRIVDHSKSSVELACLLNVMKSLKINWVDLRRDDKNLLAKNVSEIGGTMSLLDFDKTLRYLSQVGCNWGSFDLNTKGKLFQTISHQLRHVSNGTELHSFLVKLLQLRFSLNGMSETQRTPFILLLGRVLTLHLTSVSAVTALDSSLHYLKIIGSTFSTSSDGIREVLSRDIKESIIYRLAQVRFVKSEGFSPKQSSIGNFNDLPLDKLPSLCWTLAELRELWINVPRGLQSSILKAIVDNDQIFKSSDKLSFMLKSLGDLELKSYSLKAEESEVLKSLCLTLPSDIKNLSMNLLALQKFGFRVESLSRSQIQDIFSRLQNGNSGGFVQSESILWSLGSIGLKFNRMPPAVQEFIRNSLATYPIQSASSSYSSCYRLMSFLNAMSCVGMTIKDVPNEFWVYFMKYFSDNLSDIYKVGLFRLMMKMYEVGFSLISSESMLKSAQKVSLENSRFPIRLEKSDVKKFTPLFISNNQQKVNYFMPVGLSRSLTQHMSVEIDHCTPSDLAEISQTIVMGSSFERLKLLDNSDFKYSFAKKVIQCVCHYLKKVDNMVEFKPSSRSFSLSPEELIDRDTDFSSPVEVDRVRTSGNESSSLLLQGGTSLRNWFHVHELVDVLALVKHFRGDLTAMNEHLLCVLETFKEKEVNILSSEEFITVQQFLGGETFSKSPSYLLALNVIEKFKQLRSAVVTASD